MMKKNTPDLEFNISHIELIDKTIAKPPLKPLTKNDFGYEVGIEININGQEGISKHTISITAKSKDKKVEYGTITVSCTFIIFNFNQIIEQEENEVFTVPQNVFELLNSVTIGTARGVLYSEFRGTFLEKAVLPILDVKAFQAVIDKQLNTPPI